MKIPSYDLIVPLGEWCGAALWTRRLGKRACSLPLDWMLARGISLVGYAELIRDDFRSFMQKGKLSLLSSENLNPDAPADCYLDTASGLISVHDFRRGIPFEEAYPIVRQKYERRIRRLYALIGSAKRVLFLHLARKGCPSPEMARAALAILRNKFVGCRVELLVIAQDNDCEQPIITQEDGLFLTSGPYFPPVGCSRLGDRQMVRSVLRHFRLKGQWRNLLYQRLNVLLFRLRTMCHLRSEDRRAARERLRRAQGGDL